MFKRSKALETDEKNGKRIDRNMKIQGFFWILEAIIVVIFLTYSYFKL